MSSHISILKVFNAEAITQNTAENYTVDLTRYNAEGFFSLQIVVTGAGNVTITYALSNDGDTYITPTAATALFTAFGASSGEGSDGNSIASFNPMVSKYLRIIATEQNAGAVVLEADLAIQ